MMSSKRAKELTLRLLRPYTIPEHCPYLSEDQRRLSEMTIAERSAWMADWLIRARNTAWTPNPYSSEGLDT